MMANDASTYEESKIMELEPETIYAYVFEKGNWDVWGFFQTDADLKTSLLKSTTKQINSLEEYFFPGISTEKMVNVVVENGKLIIDGKQAKNCSKFKENHVYCASYYAD